MSHSVFYSFFSNYSNWTADKSSLNELCNRKAIRRTDFKDWNFRYFHTVGKTLRYQKSGSSLIILGCKLFKSSQQRLLLWRIFNRSRKRRSIVTTHNQYVTDKIRDERRFNKFDDILGDKSADWEAGKRRMSVTVPSPARRGHSQWLIGVIKSCGADIRYHLCRLHPALLAFMAF